MPEHGLAPQTVLDELVSMLAEVTGQPAAWAGQVNAASRLEGDLLIDSLEIAALGELLATAYGVDLMEFLAGLEIDQLIELTVGDVAAFVTASAG